MRPKLPQISENSIWKHGAALRQEYRTFSVEANLVTKHLPQLQEQQKKIDMLLEQSKKCEWQTLFTHPKLMSNYYWKDWKNHRSDHKVAELKHALKVTPPFK